MSLSQATHLQIHSICAVIAVNSLGAIMLFWGVLTGQADVRMRAYVML